MQGTSKLKEKTHTHIFKSPDFQSTRPHSSLLPIPIFDCISTEEGVVAEGGRMADLKSRIIAH